MEDQEYGAFLKSILPPFDGKLLELQKRAVHEGIPIIPHETACFIRMLLGILKPVSVLEIGTAVGFSASLFCWYTDKSVCVTTIDRYPYMIERAKENIKFMGLENRITLLEGDAGEILPTLIGGFDLIFLDAAKGQYINFLPDCIRLLNTGGMLISDDVLLSGGVTGSRFQVPRRQRTIHKRLRSFLWEITRNPQLETSILPVGGGLALCRKL